MKRQEAKISVLTRSAEVSAYSEEQHTVDLVFTTGARVYRPGWFGPGSYEELDVDGCRMDKEVPFLEMHRSYSLDSILGKTLRMWKDTENGEVIGRARIQFDPDHERAMYLFKRVKSGFVKAVSVGYRVHKFEKRRDDSIEEPIYRATDWTPLEISLVGIGADPDAAVRSDNDQNVVAIFEREEPKMPPVEPATATPKAENVRSVDEIDQIMTICEKANLSIPEARAYVRGTMKLTDIQNEVIDKLASRSAPVIKSSGSIEMVHDEVEKIRSAGELALLYRWNPHKYEKDIMANDLSRELINRPLVSFCETILRKRGQKIDQYDPMAIAYRSLSTSSDFPTITMNVANKIAAAVFLEEPAEYKALVSEVFVNNFKDISTIQLGSLELDEIPESGLIPRETPKESGEKYRVKKYGKMLGLTEETILNDDTNIFSRLPEEFARASRRREEERVMSLFNANPKMQDGSPIFSDNHKNITATGTKLDINSISQARIMMRSQKGLKGEPITNIPAFLLVPISLETPARQFVSDEVYAASQADVNVYKSSLSVLVSHYLTNQQAWYLAASPRLRQSIQIAYITGRQIPKVESRDTFDRVGTEWRMVHNFGVGVVDHRGLYKNNGEAAGANNG